MKTNKRQPISSSSFLGFEDTQNKAAVGTRDDLVKFIVTLIEMDRQHKAK